MKSRALIFSSLCLAMAGVGSSASGQARPIPNRVVPGNWSIVFYDQTSYQGANANFTSSTANVGSAWRRQARSVTVNGGTWQVCENPNFNGRCVTLSQSVADLGSYNLRRIGSVRPMGAAVRTAAPRDWYIVVYTRTNYHGTSRRFSTSVSNLGSTAVRSVTIGRGRWEVCTDRNFGGDCVVLDQSIPDLATEGFAGYVRSIRPAPQAR